ncbi:MAG: hypothetical protein M1827_005089 [Pycnora praestabilis]|nr:MAG: hypothetical protein M1827_005089 [Pycnora praestabilis]
MNASTASSHRRRYLANSNSNPINAPARDSATRAAKKELIAKVREDWEFNWRGPVEDKAVDIDVDAEQDSLSPMEWREREIDSSSPEPQPPPSSEISHSSIVNGNSNGISSQNINGFVAAPSTSANPYKFDSPDAIGVNMQEHVAERRRKRRKVLREEMSWNEGLACWVARRDAWSGGRVGHASSTQSSLISASTITTSSQSKTKSVASDNGATPLTPLSTDPDDILELIPTLPPLLPPTHPIRASINPSTYPQIYAKVVIQSLAPVIPINLSDVTKALVQGWKEDDQWPPKGGNVEPSFAGKRKGNNGSGVGGGGGRGTRHLTKGVGVVKKALGLGTGPGGGSTGSSGLSTKDEAEILGRK